MHPRQSLVGLVLVAVASRLQAETAPSDDQVMKPPQDEVVFPAATADGDVTVRVMDLFPDRDVVASIHVSAGESGSEIAASVEKAFIDKGFGPVFAIDRLVNLAANAGDVSVEATHAALPLPPQPEQLDAVVDGERLTVTWSIPAGLMPYDKAYVIVDGDAIAVDDPLSPLVIDLRANAVSPPDAEDGNYRVAVVGQHDRVRGTRAITVSHAPVK